VWEPVLTHYRPAMPFGNIKKNILEDLFSSVLLQLKKYHPLETLNFIIQAFSKASMEEILSISLKLNFTQNTLRCYGLIGTVY